MISALLGMLASCASSVASSHRRYESDIQSNDNLHEVDSPIWEQHELGDVTARYALFTSCSRFVSGAKRRAVLPVILTYRIYCKIGVGAVLAWCPKLHAAT